jgi:CheY-like chemotaxis protein
MVAALGMEVLCASSGPEALELFRRHADEISCVVLDLTMPEMDGLAVFEAMTQVRSDVRVVFASGFDPHEFSQKAVATRPAAVLQKPFSIEGLRVALATALVG